jgi:hypothetical protein
VCSGFYFQSHGLALAAMRDLRIDDLQQVAGLFFLKVEIAIARNAERCVRQNFVATVELGGIGRDDVLRKNILNGIVIGWNAQ